MNRGPKLARCCASLDLNRFRLNWLCCHGFCRWRGDWTVDTHTRLVSGSSTNAFMRVPLCWWWGHVVWGRYVARCWAASVTTFYIMHIVLWPCVTSRAWRQTTCLIPRKSGHSKTVPRSAKNADLWVCHNIGRIFEYIERMIKYLVGCWYYRHVICHIVAKKYSGLSRRSAS